MRKKTTKFSNDPLVELLPIKEFLRRHRDFFSAVLEYSDAFQRPNPMLIVRPYYYFDDDILACAYFDYRYANFGRSLKEKLSSIEVAYRDGSTEVSNLDKLIERRTKSLLREPKSKWLSQQIADLKKIRKTLQKRKSKHPIQKRSFDDYVIDTGHRFEWAYPGDYVVLDLETNGLRWTKDDLLSISVFSPKTGLCYNRFLPLDQQPIVLTTWLNHIKTEDLKGESHLTQEEFDALIERFHLDKVTVLCYGGGDGTFDLKFLASYCKRHDIKGYEKIKVKNIKDLVPEADFGVMGQCSKDNLCQLLGIPGVNDYHSGLNDCVLEWQLFDELMTRKLFFSGRCLVEYTDGYVVPVSYLIKHPCLADYAEIELPKITATAREVYSYSFPQKMLQGIKKYPTNITGTTVENAINALVGAKRQNNADYLLRNRMKLKYVGSLESSLIEIPTNYQDDGTIQTTDPQYDMVIEEINEVTKLISARLADVVTFIKQSIFGGEAILSQELVLSQNDKVLALCDLSNDKAVLEIKTFDPVSFSDNSESGVLQPSVGYQLFFQSKGRKTYVLAIDLKSDYGQTLNDSSFGYSVDSLRVCVYAITFDISSYDSPKDVLSPFLKPYFDAINADERCTYEGFMEATGWSRKSVQRDIQWLKKEGFIERTGSTASGSWRIIKTPSFGDK